MIKKNKKIISAEKSQIGNLVMSAVSSIIILVFFAFLGYLGLKDEISKSAVLLFISWAGFFVYPLILASKSLTPWFIRFMKDTPLLFPTFFLAPLVQGVFFGGIWSSKQGITPSSIDPTVFYVVYVIVVIFAANVHRIVGIIITQRWFLNFVNKLNIRSGTTSLSLALDKSNPDYELALKQFTYFLMMVQVFVVVFLCIIPIFIFQEVVKNDFLLGIFGGFAFFSASIMAIGVIKMICLGFEGYSSKKVSL